MPIPTFVDSSVLINAIVGDDPALKMRARIVLGDPAREFVASRFLVPEVMPNPIHLGKRREASFYERFFRGVVRWVRPALLPPSAYDLACRHNLSAMDASHVAAARLAGAELINAEKPSKPMNRLPNVTTIY